MHHKQIKRMHTALKRLVASFVSNRTNTTPTVLEDNQQRGSISIRCNVVHVRHVIARHLSRQKAPISGTEIALYAISFKAKFVFKSAIILWFNPKVMPAIFLSLAQFTEHCMINVPFLSDGSV